MLNIKSSYCNGLAILHWVSKLRKNLLKRQHLYDILCIFLDLQIFRNSLSSPLHWSKLGMTRLITCLWLCPLFCRLAFTFTFILPARIYTPVKIPFATLLTLQINIHSNFVHEQSQGLYVLLTKSPNASLLTLPPMETFHKFSNIWWLQQ